MIETKLNNLEINELAEEQYKSVKNSDSLNSDAFYMTPSSESVITPISLGGTNAQTVEEAVNNLGLGGIGEVISKSERVSLSSSGNTTNHCYTIFTEGIWYIGARCEASISYSTQIIYTLAGCSAGGGTARGTMSSGGGLFSSGIIDATKESRAAYIALYDTNTGQNYSVDISLWAIRIK